MRSNRMSTLSALLLVLTCADAPDPFAAPPCLAAVHDLAKLDAQDARRLAGRWATFTVEVDSLEWEYDDGTVGVDCRSDNDVRNGLFVVPGQAVEEETMVRAVLRVAAH